MTLGAKIRRTAICDAALSRQPKNSVCIAAVQSKPPASVSTVVVRTPPKVRSGKCLQTTFVNEARSLIDEMCASSSRSASGDV